jgi:hypothetical protein
MNNRKLAILGIVAAFMLLWAILQGHFSNKPRVSSTIQSYLIQGIDLEPADITSISLASKDSRVTLKKLDKGFGVVEKDNYPADMNNINDLLTKCLEIKTNAFVTDNPANLESLGVTESKATAVVKFFKEDSNMITGLIAGTQKELGKGTYVRLISNNKVYVANEIPFLSMYEMNYFDALSYIDSQLFSVLRANIDSVTVVDPNGRRYTLTHGADDSKSAVLEPVPAGKQAIGSECDTVFTALTNLKFTDVAKNMANLKYDRQYICKLKDSTIYSLGIAQTSDSSYITCTAMFGDTTPVKGGDPNESKEELKKKEAKLLAWDHANEFADKHKGWIYKIPENMAARLTKDIADLLEDIPKEKSN